MEYSDIVVWNQGGVEITIIHLMEGIFLFLAIVWIAKKLRNQLYRLGLQRIPSQQSSIYRVAQFAYYFILVLGGSVALSSIGFDFSKIAILLGALGVGVGLGLQTIFNNCFSGIFLLFEDSFKIGDHIEIKGDVRGEIQEFNLRTTLLKGVDGTYILVPNSLLTTETVRIFSLEKTAPPPP